MAPKHLEDLKRKLDALSPANKLLVASQLMDAGKDDLAVAIAENVVMEWRAAQLFAPPRDLRSKS